MRQYRWPLTVAAVVVVGGLALAGGETVSVRESDTRFPVRDEVTIEHRPVRLVLTGAALRKGRGLNLYTIASYIEDGKRVGSAEQLIAADVVKQLHLVSEVPLDG